MCACVFRSTTTCEPNCFLCMKAIVFLTSLNVPGTERTGEANLPQNITFDLWNTTWAAPAALHLFPLNPSLPLQRDHYRRLQQLLPNVWPGKSARRDPGGQSGDVQAAGGPAATAGVRGQETERDGRQRGQSGLQEENPPFRLASHRKHHRHRSQQQPVHFSGQTDAQRTSQHARNTECTSQVTDATKPSLPLNSVHVLPFMIIQCRQHHNNLMNYYEHNPQNWIMRTITVVLNENVSLRFYSMACSMNTGVR